MFAPRASHFNYLPRLFRGLFVIFEPDLITKSRLTALFYESGRPRSRYTVGVVVSKHAATAAAGCPSLKTKRINPHTLRYTCAMLLRSKGVDIATIALWLGHESEYLCLYRILEAADRSNGTNFAAATLSQIG